MGNPIFRPLKARLAPGRVVFVITSLSFAGAQMQLLALAKTLKVRGWQPHIVSMMAPDTPALTEDLDAAGIPWASLDLKRGSADVAALFALRRLLGEWQPDIVHSHMIHANLLARAVRLFTRVPVLLSTAHNINEGGRLRMLAYRLTDLLAEHSTNVSRAAVDRYVDIGAAPAHKISLVPNGIDTERFKPDLLARERMRAELGLGEAFCWLAVGRHDEQKDYRTMLEALATLVASAEPDSAADVKLVVVGEGPFTADLKQLATRLDVAQRVDFLEVRSDIPELMNAADAYLMSSVYEGLPMVLLEAASTALPIVATQVGGNAEIVTPANGFLVPPGKPGALAEGMVTLLGLSPEERRAMGLAGREHVIKNYGLEHIVDTWENLYRYWLDKKGVEPTPT